MTNEEKQQIIDLMKRHIDENDNVRVGWAAEHILKSKQQNHILDKLSAAITKTNEYIREPANPNFAYDWNIRKNPTYKKESWSDRNKFLHDVIIVLITSVLTLIVGIILWRLDKRSTSQEIQQLKDKIYKIENPSDTTTKK
jgi:hypothetical protein